MKKRLTIEAIILTLLITTFAWATYVGDIMTYGKKVTMLATTFGFGGVTITAPAASATISGVRQYYRGTAITSTSTNKSSTGLFYSGSIDVTTGSGLSYTVTGLSPAFSGTNTYSCLASSNTNTGTGNVWKCANTGTDRFTLTTGTAVNDRVAYILMGY